MAEGVRGAALPHRRDKQDANHRRNPPRPMSKKSINLALALVRQVWNLAAAEPHNYAVGDWPGKVKVFKKPRVENERQRYLTAEEAISLLARLAKSSQQVKGFCSLPESPLWRTGGGAFRPHMGSDLFEKAGGTLFDTKNGESRKAFCRAPHDMLLRRKSERENGQVYVFTSSKGGKIKQLASTFGRVVKELKLNEGVTDKRMRVCFHTLRHTFASWVLDCGGNLKTVQNLLGHKTLAMTVRYLHVNEDSQKAAVVRLGDSIDQSET